MSKKTISKNKLEQQNDIDYKVAEPIVESDDEKPKKTTPKRVKVSQKTKSEQQNDVENSNRIEVINDNEKNQIEPDGAKQKDNKKKKLSKNELYEKDQKIFFAEMKDLIGVKKNGSFTSKDIQKEGILDSILIGMKKYYDSEMTRGISGKDTKTILALIRKVCNHHEYDIVKKELKTSTDRSYVYYIVSQKEE